MGEESTKYPTWKWIVIIAVMIIGFLSVRGIDAFTARIVEQESVGTKLLAANQEIRERLVKLEANYSHIIDGIGDIKRNQERVASNLTNSESERRVKDMRK